MEKLDVICGRIGVMMEDDFWDRRMQRDRRRHKRWFIHEWKSIVFWITVLLASILLIIGIIAACKYVARKSIENRNRTHEVAELGWIPGEYRLNSANDMPVKKIQILNITCPTEGTRLPDDRYAQ